MFYDFSNKRKMECERYQDCSWFQQDSMKESIKGKLSLAETAEPIIDCDDFDLAMQYATDQSIPRGEDDAYLSGLDDVFTEGPEKNDPNLNDDYVFTDAKKLEDPAATDGLNQFYGLRKTDSFDNMEYISSTNPAEIIPISLMERMNYANGGLSSMNTMKSDAIKEEKSYSPDSTSHLIPHTDEGDLFIGREETVEENEASEQICKPAVIDDKLISLQDPGSFNSTVEGDESFKTDCIERECLPTSTIKTESISDSKLELNLDLPKVNFEQAFGMSTPDLDFMDLVEFINEDMKVIRKSDSSSDQKENIISTTTNTVTRNRKKFSSNNILKMGNASQENTETTSATPSKEEENHKAEESNELPDETTSIAERIKTKAKRRVTMKCVTESGSASEDGDDDDDFEPDEEGQEDDDDDDDDYDYEVGGGNKRRCTVAARRPRTSSEAASAVAMRGQAPERAVAVESAEKIDSYRERRDKNNEASRRSRQNRKDRERRMFKTLEEEEKRNVKLRAEADVLEKQVTSLRKLLLQVVLRKAEKT